MIRAQFLAGAAGAAAATVGRAQDRVVAQIIPVTPTFRFGVVCPQSGPDGRLGKELLAGVRGAVDEINRDRPSFQSLVLYSAYDDHNTPAQATVQADFRLPVKDSDEGGLVAAYVVKSGSKAPHVVSQDGGYGPQVAAGFLRRASALHVNAVGTQFSLDNPDYDNAAGAVLSHDPDFVVLAGNADDMGPLMETLRTKGFTGRFVGTQGFFDAQTIKQFAKVAEGLVVSAPVPYYPLAPTVTRFIQDYQGQYGPLTPVAAYGYAAVQLIYNAAQRTNAKDRLAMIRAIANGGSYDTITGSYSFGPSGDVLDPNCYFYRIADGKFTYERQAHPSGFMLK
jgi:ABC-type branched-subunit amino acid transport system substrate-binding protein